MSTTTQTIRLARCPHIQPENEQPIRAYATLRTEPGRYYRGLPIEVMLCTLCTGIALDNAELGLQWEDGTL